MRVRVLGPLRLLDGSGRDVTPTGGLQRRLLALLVLRRGEVVPADHAVDALWPDGLPADPSAALQNHVSRLRRLLPAGAIESVGDGYRLQSSAVEVDADHLHDLLALGTRVAPDELDELLARWQGPAYDDLDDLDDARAERLRLDELRLRAHELSAECRLLAGSSDGLVARLLALAEAEPLRERPRALLMAALAATGRHAEALRVYDDFRRRLGDELGIEPSPALAAQHDALLQGDGPRAMRRLPLPATSLVGRDAERAQLLELVGAARVVTLVGPGGIGKTRLLLEAGHGLATADHDRPVVLCELAAVDHSSAVHAVAMALGVDPRPSVPIAEQVAGVLGDAQVALLLDNCEHVVEPVAALVEHLVARCPGLRVIATSRERLRVPGEQVCAVPPLAVTNATQLFVERARSVRPDLHVGEAELAVVTEIVQRLDGLPLAIELAAARLFTHDLDEVAAGLEHRFALLTTGARTSARHRTLAAAIAWSVDLLDDTLREIFLAASVFAGPFTAADVAAICDVDERAASSALIELAERSLVGRDSDRRFVLLESLRSFGAEQLAAAGREDDLRSRHARHLVAWAEHADQRLAEPGAQAIAEIDAAVPELHAALTWLVDHGELTLASRLVLALQDYGFLRLRPDVLGWAEWILLLDPDDDQPMAPQMWVVAAQAAWMAGNVLESRARGLHAYELGERRGEMHPVVIGYLGDSALFVGLLDEAAHWNHVAALEATDDWSWRILCSATEVLALAYAEQPDVERRALEVLADAGDAVTPYAAFAWYAAGEAALQRDEPLALARFEVALGLAEQTRAVLVTGVAGASRASIIARSGDPVEAAGEFTRLIEHWRRASMWPTQWTMLRSIAQLLARLDRAGDAAVLLGALRATDEGHRIFGADELALRELEARLRSTLGDTELAAAFERGAALDGDQAVEHARRALAVTSGAAP